MFIANLTKNVIDIINNIDIIYIYCMIVSLTEIWNLFPYGKIIFPEDIARGKCDFSGGKNLHISQTFMQKIIANDKRLQCTSSSNSFVTLKKQKFCDWFTFYDNYHVSFTNSNNV